MSVAPWAATAGRLPAADLYRPCEERRLMEFAQQSRAFRVYDGGTPPLE